MSAQQLEGFHHQKSGLRLRELEIREYAASLVWQELHERDLLFLTY